MGEIYGRQIHTRAKADPFIMDWLHINLDINEVTGKPMAALWTSSLIENADYKTKWHEWCTYEMPGLIEDSTMYEVIPNKSAKILVVDWCSLKVVDLNGDVIIPHEKMIRSIDKYTIHEHNMKGYKSLVTKIFPIYYLDWSQLVSNGIDIVQITESAALSAHAALFCRNDATDESDRIMNSILLGMEFWDCESSVWLNKDAIADVREFK